jgi:hypothetical protein
MRVSGFGRWGPSTAASHRCGSRNARRIDRRRRTVTRVGDGPVERHQEVQFIPTSWWGGGDHGASFSIRDGDGVHLRHQPRRASSQLLHVLVRGVYLDARKREEEEVLRRRIEREDRAWTLSPFFLIASHPYS